MGGRYLVTGSQLGTLIALCKLDADKCNKLLNEITANYLVDNLNKKKDFSSYYKKYIVIS